MPDRPRREGQFGDFRHLDELIDMGITGRASSTRRLPLVAQDWFDVVRHHCRFRPMADYFAIW